MMKQYVRNDGKAKFLHISFWAKAQNVRKFVGVVGNDRQFAIYIGDRTGPNGSVSHDWQQYKSFVKVPTTESEVMVSLEMYGPGTIWIDDVTASFSDSASLVGDTNDDAMADVKDVKNEDLRAGSDPLMRYFLIGAHAPEPASGYKLLVVLPGGAGSAGFNPFIRRVWKNALPPGYLIAELVAPQWSDNQFETIVWPTRKQKWQGMKFATEDFVEKVIKDVQKKHKIDASKVYTMSWSSGGPAAYAASLGVPAIKGSFVAMSIFRPEQLPPLFGAKGQAYYIYHSPEGQAHSDERSAVGS
jgi:hypothetical protein